MFFRDMLKDKLANVIVYGGTAMVVLAVGLFGVNYMIERSKEQAKEAVVEKVQAGKELVVQAKNTVVDKVDAAKDHAVAAKDTAKEQVSRAIDHAHAAADTAKEKASGLIHKFQKE